MYDSKRWGKFIKRNLDNHVRYFNEIIILDTGSTDSTMSILKSMKKKIQTLKFIQQIGKMIFLKLETMLSLLQQTIGSYF